ncbi:uncharacterized protein BXZ73DRAFT_76917 [Epithele typhae]|uniref:uncharacterized protein n=1 Tax=Epithele typhae TaxID=378194 RepID=UPI002007BC23|nr:uncharacterized protein BXZ73DRAFT_76917 [Epithele typhae]KAH9935224.1 hypothetical protein BXZ73DRAFT_76917 [Epithele typhae]
MATPDPWLKSLDSLELRLDACRDEDMSDEGDTEPHRTQFTKTLEDVCAVVRDAERKGSPDLPRIVEKAEQILMDAIWYARSAESELPTSSFAHSEDEPLLEDSMEYPGSDLVDALKLFSRMLNAMNPGTGPSIPISNLPGLADAPSWIDSLHPHPLTTRLSRFREGYTPNTTTLTPLAHTIYQARAQLTIDSLASGPWDMSLSSGGSILALSGGSGWKLRDPCLQWYPLGQQSEDSLEGGGMDPGLAQVARYITADESRKLIFLGDDDRVKSFSFNSTTRGRRRDELPNVHTMNSRQFRGPILVLPDGRLARAGKGRAAVWNVDALETHQDKPGELIGPGEVNLEDTWRDNDGDDIELSTGTVPTTSTPFGDPNFSPNVLHLHQPTGHVLFGAHSDDKVSCAMLDLEAGGRIVTRFLGHGGEVAHISTDSRGNPNLFVTACTDGYARMFDVRHPLPVLTFNVEREKSHCGDVVLVHPDGIPTLFTAGTRSHQVKLWDIRAKQCVYELSTGNNDVNGLAWDSATSSLFVATECENMDRMGNRMDYRRARVPRWATWKAAQAAYKRYQEAIERGEAITENTGPVTYDQTVVDSEEGEEDEEWEDDEDDDDMDDEYDDGKRWPKRTFHREDYFGYTYDAGDHMLFRWQFKEIPDCSQLPPSFD